MMGQPCKQSQILIDLYRDTTTSRAVEPFEKIATAQPLKNTGRNACAWSFYISEQICFIGQKVANPKRLHK